MFSPKLSNFGQIIKNGTIFAYEKINKNAMDKEKAKEFIFYDMFSPGDKETIYISKDLDKLIEMNDGSLNSIYAVVDTESGEKLFCMDFAYSGEPIIMQVFLHKDYFMKAMWNREVKHI